MIGSQLFDTDSEEELPSGWEQRTTVDGKIFYANHVSRSTQWTHPVSGKRRKVPKDLPYGWERRYDDTGNPYYFELSTQRVTYADPRLAFVSDDTTSQMKEVKRRFDGSTRALQILQGLDLSGKHVVITGANTGIGFETARALALHGAHVVLACRNMKYANEAIAKIRGENPKAEVDAISIDLSCLRSVKQFAENYQNRNWPLHILILNAGVFGMPHTLTEDGYESTFQINHLAHFYLVQCLLPIMRQFAPGRIVVLSSESHRFTDLNMQTISEVKLSPPATNFRPMLAYNQSKLCNVLFSNELNRRLMSHSITCNAVHPGNMIYTDISRYWWFWKVLFTLVRPFTKDKQQGAATTVFCAIDEDLEGYGGMYFNNCFNCKPMDEALKLDTAVKLWELSELMIRKAKTLQSSEIIKT